MIVDMNEVLPHENTLLGAIDTYLKSLVHVRPHLAKRFEWHLEEMAEHWLEEGGANTVAAIEQVWLKHYLRRATDRKVAEQVIRDFYRWARNNSLTEHDPLRSANTDQYHLCSERHEFSG